MVLASLTAVGMLGSGLSAAPAVADTTATEKCITASQGVECAFIDSKSSKSWKTVYSRSQINKITKYIPLTCTESSSTSFSVTTTVGLKAEFQAWVFAKMEASVGVALTWNWSASGTSTSGPVKVPKGWKYTCKFGTYLVQVNGHTKRYTGAGVTTRYWSFTAPQEEKGWKWTKVRVG
ncbi:MAG: hypothetical protein QM619_11895 [Micropruina sp.]